MSKLLESLYSNLALAELDHSKPRGAPNVDPGAIRIMVTHNKRLNTSHDWVTRKGSLLQFEPLFLHHREFARKDEAPAFLPGVLQGDRRLRQAVSQLDWLIIDLDKGEDIRAVIAAVKATGLYALIHSTFSHLTPKTAIGLDDYRKFANGKDVTVDGLRSYLLEVRNCRPWVVENVEVTEAYKETPSGAVCVARHAPLPKYRLLFPLGKPFSGRDHCKEGGTQKSFEALWKAKYMAFANSLGLEWDHSCTDISRAFYWPSCKPGAERMAMKIDGQLPLHLQDETGERRKHRPAAVYQEDVGGWVADA